MPIATNQSVPNTTNKSLVTNATRSSVTNSTVSAVSHEVEKKHMRPVGEGAYQDPKAVAERTTDKSKDCEKGKWEDCFHRDYIDNRYDVEAHPDKPHVKKEKSGGAKVAVSSL